MKTIFSILFSATLLVSVAQQPTPAPKQKKSVLLLYATAHIGTGEVINQSVIGFRDGVIDFVGNALTANLNELKYDTTINLKGKHIYPGFIGLNSTIGLVEIEAVRASVDNYEVGEFNPAVRSLIAYNTDSEIQPTVRTNGVLMAQITPRGGTITGSSSVVHFDAWNWEDATIKTDDGVHLNWPRMYRRSGWWAEPGETKRSENYDKQKTEIVDYFKKAKAYYETKNKDYKDLNLEAMKGLFDGSKKLYVTSDFVKEIQDIITFKKEMGLQHVVVVGGYDAWMVAPQLKENNMAVVLRRVHDLPMRTEDDVDLPYKLPKLLQDAGVLFCLQNAGDMEQMGLRNLPFYAGTARAYGLTEEQAIAAVSYNAARILGIDNKVGSLQKGKDATFFISDGDALDMRTNNIILAYIQGRKISLTNRQIELYEKYKTKYGVE
jgi:imidazolonepropionase-like amidohydrolase